MNRHERRTNAGRMLGKIERGFQKIQAEGQGVWNMRVITRTLFCKRCREMPMRRGYALRWLTR
jgi:hypothetical protein